ncbi:Spy/CpxP family protein refolding chaperone [Leptothoe sp. PORK10 BA2]|uniref:Spy/CpxP family protein refolding chaperone n=1 Tax=Leptothoe sp. PORK10 BA2 TaxID=3110254 RepID=UPI002B216413|nr:Spy/CpxP family protein refolding chaperone [Leptothoe sp. PORK10 BA2]MEA5463897.1 Spy/CpxP family protein refolding chaperone [Leptothoe sp. PORK10 BA2]
MKRQFGLLLSSATLLTAMTTVAIAQTNPSHLPSTKAHSEISAMAKGGPGGNISEIQELDLTADQQEELEDIQADIVEQMSEVLTPEQVEVFTESQNSGDTSSMRSMMMSLDGSQRSSVMSIMRSAEDDMMDVLTPEQREQIEGSDPRDRN